jgi:1-acyl-sn-glycerol-3-phosphate acyltransferase
MILFMPVGIIAIMLYALNFRKFSQLLVYFAARTWARQAIMLSGCKIVINGIENIPKTDGLCVVSNHSGYMDILLLLAYIGRPLGFMAKKELSYIPFLNIWILIMGGHFIDRKRPSKALKAINNGIKQIKSGGALIIFPEGTRSKGMGLLPFHSGSFKLALRSDATILPVAISGTYELYEKYGKVVPCTISISFGNPLLSDFFKTHEEKQNISDTVRTLISGMLNRQTPE